MSGSNCHFLTCIQISQEADKVVWYSHLFQNFSQLVVIYTVKGFNIVNESEVDSSLEFSCFFNDPADVDNLISGSSAFSKSSLSIWKFSVHVLLKPSLENFKHYFPRVWDECHGQGQFFTLLFWAFYTSFPNHHLNPSTGVPSFTYFWHPSSPLLCLLCCVLYSSGP